MYESLRLGLQDELENICDLEVGTLLGLGQALKTRTMDLSELLATKNSRKPIPSEAFAWAAERLREAQRGLMRLIQEENDEQIRRYQGRLSKWL